MSYMEERRDGRRTAAVVIGAMLVVPILVALFTGPSESFDECVERTGRESACHTDGPVAEWDR